MFGYIIQPELQQISSCSLWCKWTNQGRSVIIDIWKVSWPAHSLSVCPDIIHQYKLHYYAALSIVEFCACRVHSDVCVCGDEIACGGLECHCYNTSSCVLADHSWSGLSGPDTDADATHSQGPPGQDLCNALGERLQVELFVCRQCCCLQNRKLFSVSTGFWLCSDLSFFSLFCVEYL